MVFRRLAIVGLSRPSTGSFLEGLEYCGNIARRSVLMSQLAIKSAIESIMRTARNKAVVTVYSRPGCHLCEEAIAEIESAGCDGEFSLEEVNIDDDPVLLERYQYDIPVVLINGIRVFKHRVDPRDFKRKLRRLSKTEGSAS
jgi:glutaredoxin